jgi:hypothetical protein
VNEYTRKLSHWTLQAVDQKDLKSFEMWCWRRMEKISWIDHVRSVEVLLSVNEQRNVLHEIRRWKANWIGHILRTNCLLQQVIEGKMEGGLEVKGRRGRRRRKLLDDLKDKSNSDEPKRVVHCFIALKLVLCLTVYLVCISIQTHK